MKSCNQDKKLWIKKALNRLSVDSLISEGGEVMQAAAEVVVKILESEGITTAFGIPGAGINPVYKYLGKYDKTSIT